MKVCRTCGVEKPLSEFYARSDRRTARGSCKVCWNAASRAHQKANPERYREYGRSSRAKQDRWVRTIWERWRLTPEDFDAMAAQGGLCLICKKPPRHKSTLTDEIQRFHVDHDHRTGKIRGLLCGTCNRMLGQAQDDPAVLRAGADYLENASLRSVS